MRCSCGDVGKRRERNQEASLRGSENNKLAGASREKRDPDMEEERRVAVIHEFTGNQERIKKKIERERETENVFHIKLKLN